jgi:hypothetical protein
LLLAGAKNVDEFAVQPGTGITIVRNLATGQQATASNKQVWQMLLAAEQAAELLVCAIHDADGDGDTEGYMGLVEGHAYSIKEVRHLERCAITHTKQHACMELVPHSSAVLCCAVLCCAVLCCAVLCCAVLCCAVLCCAVL